MSRHVLSTQEWRHVILALSLSRGFLSCQDFQFLINSAISCPRIQNFRFLKSDPEPVLKFRWKRQMNISFASPNQNQVKLIWFMVTSYQYTIVGPSPVYLSFNLQRKNRIFCQYHCGTVMSKMFISLYVTKGSVTICLTKSLIIPALKVLFLAWLLLFQTKDQLNALMKSF